MKTQTKNLNKLWGNKQIVLNLNQAKAILNAFENESIKDEAECLIFEDKHFGCYRKVGDLDDYKVVSYKGGTHSH